MIFYKTSAWGNDFLHLEKYVASGYSTCPEEERKTELKRRLTGLESGPNGIVAIASTHTSCQPQNVAVASRGSARRVWPVRCTT